MIEEAGGGKRGINSVGRAGQNGISGYVDSLKQRGEEGVLVLAVPISIDKNFRCGMRSVATETEIDPDIAKMRRHELVKRSYLLLVCRFALGKLFRLRADFSGYCGLWLCQIVEPIAHLFPRRKGRDLNIRRRDASVVFLPCGNFGFFSLFKIYVLKGIYVTSAIIPDGRLGVGVA